MAIGLNDIKQNRKRRNESVSIENNPIKELPSNKKSLRPWESYDETAHRTRTLAAQEAVKRARKIVQKNNEMSSTLLERAMTKDRLDHEISSKSVNQQDVDDNSISHLHEIEELSFSLTSRRVNNKRGGVTQFLRSMFGM